MHLRIQTLIIFTIFFGKQESLLLFIFQCDDYLYMNYINISVNKFTNVIIDADLNVFMCCILL
jgi:hypothetical protein